MKTIKESDKQNYTDQHLGDYLKQIYEEELSYEEIVREERKTFLKRRFYLLYKHGKI